jgi:glycosyltransferase involved in cell wall biosynthesis
LHIGFIGRLDPKKGVENLLDACALMAANGLPFTLTIAGGGPERYTRKLRARVDQLALRPRVQFIGEAYNRAKREFFEGINLLAVPSHTENFAIVVAEALAAGLPVIASRGTPWSRLEDEGCGLWVDNSPASLAAALERMREAPLLAMGQRGRQWMRADFAWGAAARTMCNLYSSLAYGEQAFHAQVGTAADSPPSAPLGAGNPDHRRMPSGL